nr:hypothetical protein GCM10025732_48750 [Glycomyces mayteni]
MTGVMGGAYARGLKGDNGAVWKTAPTVKHFLAYGNEADRCTTSSNMPPRVLREYEFAAHRPALASGDAVAVMLSYNLVNGRPAHVTPLVNTELRTWTTDEVFIVSDAYAPNNLAQLQGYFEDLPTAYAAAVKAGLDSFTQDDDRPEGVLAHLVTALDRGLLDESDIDTAVRRNLFVRFGLGEFDPEDPYTHIGREAVNSPSTRRSRARPPPSRSRCSRTTASCRSPPRRRSPSSARSPTSRCRTGTPAPSRTPSPPARPSRSAPRSSTARAWTASACATTRATSPSPPTARS